MTPNLLIRELRREGYEISSERADTAAGLSAALDAQTWDIVLCDFNMPRFSGLEALQIVRGRGLDVPFIFVSGAIGEDVAVAAMKAGAQDYVMKGQLKRLPPAIERELRDAAVRRERGQSEAAPAFDGGALSANPRHRSRRHPRVRRAPQHRDLQPGRRTTIRL